MLPKSQSMLISKTASWLEVMVTPSSPDTQLEWDRHFELYFNGKETQQIGKFAKQEETETDNPLSPSYVTPNYLGTVASTRNHSVMVTWDMT